MICSVLYLNGPAGLFGADNDLLSLLNSIIFLVFMILLFTGLNQKIQMMIWVKNIRKYLSRIEVMAKEAKVKSVETIKKMGGSNAEELVNRMIEFFIISPVSEEPTGLMRRLEHLLNIRDERFKKAIKAVLPEASKHEVANAGVILEIAIALNAIFRTVRHYLILGEKTNNWILITQLQLEMPQIYKLSHAYYKAIDSFTQGKPIGDGIGPLVAAVLSKDGNKKIICEDTIMSEVERKGRKLIVVKAEGPGANVGKPGEAVAKLVKEYEGNIKRIIMVDAKLKLEGEETGDVIEGVGAAIGGLGPEKFKIENIAAHYNIPLDAIVIKESVEESISAMTKRIADAADKVLEIIDRTLIERTKEGDIVIVAGIGNTVGIAQ